MRVELTEFCQEFTTVLRPLRDTLDHSIVSLHQNGEDPTVRELLSSFADVQHRLKILMDKAEQQHAYLLIFGPLKSGKSTLMNAISGAYVSEVSSLPAYPCLVYVHEGEQRQCSATRFDGTTLQFEDEGELHRRIQEAHAELAEELRRADREQRPFNPSVDFPGAIRRVDFTLPAPNLRQSGTILVDTPGLYTKMRYNYEQLTRDFRHNAACAVFVVKTDNLFFDQVFDEFKDLLSVFSRIFLVVNIDSSKQDLSPEGRLQPSLESRDPRRIIQAFEDLTVSAQMRAAIDDGRLQIYLVDLLRTAQQSLSGERYQLPIDQRADPEHDADQAVTTPELSEVSREEILADSQVPEGPDAIVSNPDSEVANPGAVATARLGFDAFLHDLTTYLNSSGYIVEFMADSLRQVTMLIEELRRAAGSEAVSALREATREIEGRMETIQTRLAHLEALEALDWDANLEAVKAELDVERQAFSESTLSALRTQLHTQVGNWFQSEDSVRDLVTRRLQPAIVETDKQLAERAESLARTRFQQRNGGLKLDAQTIGHLQQLDISFDDIAGEIVGETLAEPNRSAPSRIDLGQEELPVKRRWIDWVLFRSPNRVRRCVLGEDNPSYEPIPSTVKEKRLGEAGRVHLLEKVDKHIGEDLRTRDETKLNSLVAAFREHYVQAVRSRLEQLRRELQAEASSLQQRRREHQNIEEALDALAITTQTAEDASEMLRGRFVVEKSRLLDNASMDSEAPADSADRER